MNNNEFYTCPYCKEEYSTPADLAHCILSCEEKKRIEEEKAKKAKLKEEKEARKSEVDACIAHCKELIKEYMNDYGTYSFTSDDEDVIFGSRLWNLIW